LPQGKLNSCMICSNSLFKLWSKDLVSKIFHFKELQGKEGEEKKLFIV